MKMFDRIIEAIVFIMFSAFSGYGFFSFFQMLDGGSFIATPILNAILGLFFGVCNLVILILLRRLSQ